MSIQNYVFDKIQFRNTLSCKHEAHEFRHCVPNLVKNSIRGVVDVLDGSKLRDVCDSQRVHI
jgi:hypothetical protein